jgi:hypothetical protein
MKEDKMLRRSVLGLLGGSAAAALLPKSAQATLVIGLTLEQLVDRSAHIVVVSALEASSFYSTIGGRRCIVTETRVQVQDVLGRRAPADQVLSVRTLGGKVGGMGELVLGQASFSSAAPDVAFLKRGADGAHWFVGMAQGHYPLHREGAELSLRPSSNLPEIREFSTSAVRALSGQRLGLARGLIREAGAR